MTTFRAVFPGGYRDPALVYVVALVVVAALGLSSALGRPLLPFWTGLNWGSAAEIPPLTIGVWAVGFVVLGLAVVNPLFGLFAYLLITYSVQGTEPAYQVIYRQGIAHWAMAFAVTGGVLWRWQRGALHWFPREPLALAVAAFLAWIGVCFIAAELAGRDAPPRWNREPVYFLHCFAVFWLAVSFLRSRREFLALAGLMAAVLLFRWAASPVAIYNESYIASYLAILFPLLVGASRTSEHVAVTSLFALGAIAVAAIVLHIQNRAAVLAIVVALLIYLLMSLSRLRATVLSLVFVAAVVIGLPQTPVWDRFEGLGKGLTPGAERVALWHGGIAMFKEYPLFGVGPGQYSGAVHQYTDGIGRGGQPDAHNSFVEVLAETGAVGLLLFCWMLLVALGYLYQVTASAGGLPWTRHAARGLLASFCAYIVVSMLNSRHDLTLIYVLLGVSCLVRARWLDRRSAGD